MWGGNGSWYTSRTGNQFWVPPAIQFAPYTPETTVIAPSLPPATTNTTIIKHSSFQDMRRDNMFEDRTEKLPASEKWGEPSAPLRGQTDIRHNRMLKRALTHSWSSSAESGEEALEPSSRKMQALWRDDDWDLEETEGRHSRRNQYQDHFPQTIVISDDEEKEVKGEGTAARPIVLESSDDDESFDFSFEPSVGLEDGDIPSSLSSVSDSDDDEERRSLTMKENNNDATGADYDDDLAIRRLQTRLYHFIDVMQIPTERSLLLPPLGEVAPEILHSSNRSIRNEESYRRGSERAEEKEQEEEEKEESEEEEEEETDTEEHENVHNRGFNHLDAAHHNNREGCPHEAVQCPVCQNSFCINIIEEHADVCAEQLEWRRMWRDQLQQQRDEREKKMEELERLRNKPRAELPTSYDRSDCICTICMELFVDPRITYCSHTFCEHCLEQLKKNKTECPLCRAPIYDSVDRYTKNTQLVDWIQTHYAEEYKQRLEEVKEWKSNFVCHSDSDDDDMPPFPLGDEDEEDFDFEDDDLDDEDIEEDDDEGDELDVNPFGAQQRDRRLVDLLVSILQQQPNRFQGRSSHWGSVNLSGPENQEREIEREREREHEEQRWQREIEREIERERERVRELERERTREFQRRTLATPVPQLRDAWFRRLDENVGERHHFLEDDMEEEDYEEEEEEEEEGEFEEEDEESEEEFENEDDEDEHEEEEQFSMRGYEEVGRRGILGSRRGTVVPLQQLPSFMTGHSQFLHAPPPPSSSSSSSSSRRFHFFPSSSDTMGSQNYNSNAQSSDEATRKESLQLPPLLLDSDDEDDEWM